MITKFLATGNTMPQLRPLTLKGTPYSNELLDFIIRTIQEVPSRRCKASDLLKHPFITKRKFKIHDLDGSSEYKSDREIHLVVLENERERIREKIGLFSKASKFEQIMMHFVSAYNRQESLSRSLRIAFEN